MMLRIGPNGDGKSAVATIEHEAERRRRGECIIVPLTFNASRGTAVMHRDGDGLRYNIDGEHNQGPHGEEDEPLETSGVATGGDQEYDVEAEIDGHHLAVDDVGERSATCL